MKDKRARRAATTGERKTAKRPTRESGKDTSPKKVRTTPVKMPAACFARVRPGGKGGGFAVAAAVVEGFGNGWDVAQVLVDRSRPSGGGGRQDAGGVGKLRTLGGKKRITAAAEVCAALGHPMRLAVLAKLLEGPATYRQLQQTTGLKPGPLYHHVNQLRLASLVLPRRRDLYEMTRGGRNALLLVLAAVPLVQDARARRAVGG